MKTLHTFGLKNFRIFDDKEGFLEEFAPITLLTGANNSGKSSIIKALQMLNNSVKVNQKPFDLDFEEQNHLLGDTNNILNNKKNKTITVSLPFNFLGLNNIYITLTFIIPSEKNTYNAKLRKVEVFEKKEDDKITIFSFEYQTATESEIKKYEDEYNNKISEYYNKNNINPLTDNSEHPYENEYNPIVANVNWKINKIKLHTYLTNLLKGYEIYLDKTEKEKKKKIFAKKTFSIPSPLKSFGNTLDINTWQTFLNILSKNNEIAKGTNTIRREDFEPQDYFYPTNENTFYYEVLGIIRKELEWNFTPKGKSYNYSIIEKLFENSWNELIEKISSINYLSNLKESNTRMYNASSNSQFVNLLKDVYKSEIIDYEFINKYLERFEIGKKIDVKYYPEYELIRVLIITMNDATRKLVDFGYGIKQLIIILIQISVLASRNEESNHSSKENNTFSILLIEEPETNLHPKWQSLLAEMFLEAQQKFNIQFIIETHSEYMIKKFQTLIAQKEAKENIVKILYLRNKTDKNTEKKQVESISIQNDGTINYKAFDSGFFDESTTLESSLLNINFLKDFEIIKNSNKEADEKLKEIEKKLDAEMKKQDIETHRTEIKKNFDTSKLTPISIEYLASGQSMLEITNNTGDFSPVIIQYGRTVENELKNIFIEVDNVKPEKWMLQKMTNSLKCFKNEQRLSNQCSITESETLKDVMKNRFKNPTNLKIDLLDELTKDRNSAAHPGDVKTKQEAENYISKVNKFLKKWIEEKKIFIVPNLLGSPHIF